MQELIQQVMDRAGISEETATAAVATVIDYIRQRVPAPIAAQLEPFLTGDSAASVIKTAEGLLGGFFGRRKGEEEQEEKEDQ